MVQSNGTRTGAGRASNIQGPATLRCTAQTDPVVEKRAEKVKII
jgi:hypothetical protein